MAPAAHMQTLGSAKALAGTSLRASRPLPRLARASHAAQAVAAPEASTREGPLILNGQVLHSITKERLELVGSLDNFAQEHILPLLKPTAKCWQPQDFLPAPESPEFMDAVRTALVGGLGVGLCRAVGVGPLPGVQPWGSQLCFWVGCSWEVRAPRPASATRGVPCSWRATAEAPARHSQPCTSPAPAHPPSRR